MREFKKILIHKFKLKNPYIFNDINRFYFFYYSNFLTIYILLFLNYLYNIIS